MSTSTTTNYGWTIPNDDELVKNGAAAIRTLGQAIDTTAAASFATGFSHVSTTNFTGVASQSFNDVFTSTYNNYRIIYEGNASNTVSSFDMRLRASGSDNSSSLYYRQRINSDSTSLTGARVSASSSFGIGELQSTDRDFFIIDLINPNLAQATGIFFNQARQYATSSVKHILYMGGHSGSTQFDGFSLIISGSGITFGGTVSIYGYAKA